MKNFLKQLKNNFRLVRYVSNSGCDECRCYEPCRGYSCPDGTQCQPELVSEPVDPQREDQGSVTRVQPTCRPTTKEGRCPSVQRIQGGRSSSCEEECRSDADCQGDYKCCFNGCGRSCLSPHGSETPAVQTTTPFPIRGGSAPRIVDGETRATGEEGSVANLRCEAVGSPAPTIYWRRGNEEVRLKTQRTFRSIRLSIYLIRRSFTTRASTRSKRMDRFRSSERTGPTPDRTPASPTTEWDHRPSNKSNWTSKVTHPAASGVKLTFLEN